MDEAFAASAHDRSWHKAAVTFAAVCPQLVGADLSSKMGDSRFDVVDGACSRRRIAVR
jgi:hypothetical protein